MSKNREIDELVERMILVLESQRRLGGNAYPPTLERLAELCEVHGSNPIVPNAAGKKLFKDRAVVAWNKDRKPDREAIVFLATGDELGEVTAEVAPVVLVSLLSRAKETKTQALSVAEVGNKLTTKLQAPFKAAITSAIEQRALPSEIGSIRKGRSRLLFHLDAIETSAERPSIGSNGQANTTLRADQEPTLTGLTPGDLAPDEPSEFSASGSGDFAAAFREAFDHLDRANRSTNFVRLLELRRALPGFDREQFDAGLRQLRLADEFTLDSHEGRHGPLSDEERAAGIREAGSLLVYVSRRS